MKTIKQIVCKLRSGRFGHFVILITVMSLVLLSCSEDETNTIVPVPGSSLDMTLESKINAGPSAPEVLDIGFVLQGASGSAIGPGGDLFVTEGGTGNIYRINLKKGEVSTYATGLPLQEIPVGGVIDVAFIGSKAYALVSIVGLFTGEKAGIYELSASGDHELIANHGQWSIDNPPSGFPYFLDIGVQYAMDVYQGKLLVTDGHHNRVLLVSTEGDITEFKTFGNIAPTGLAVHGNTVFMAQAGPVDHLPEDGKVLSFNETSEVTEVASGSPLLVDVEFGRGQSLFALSQGYFEPGGSEGSPANPDTGDLVQVNSDGTFTVLVSEIDRPTSMEIVGNTAYIVSLSGNILKISNIGSTPSGF